MLTLLRRAGLGLAVLFVFLALTVLAVYGVSNRRLARHYSVQPTVFEIPTLSAEIERGHHIALTRGCLDCHGPDLGGAKVIDDPAMGRIHGPNLTGGKGGVTSAYTDADWIRAIRHGVNASGRPLFLMPSLEYSLLSNDDLGAVIAYAKSVPPVDRETVPVNVGPVARALVLAGKFPISAERIDHEHLRPSTVTPGISAEYGHYLAAGCVGCHNPSYSGGKIEVGPPDWPHAANLTPDTSSALSKWAEADFLAALRTGHRPDGTQISPVMPRNFGQMTDTELKAIWAFLKSLPAKPTGQR